MQEVDIITCDLIFRQENWNLALCSLWSPRNTGKFSAFQLLEALEKMALALKKLLIGLFKSLEVVTVLKPKLDLVSADLMTFLLSFFYPGNPIISQWWTKLLNTGHTNVPRRNHNGERTAEGQESHGPGPLPTHLSSWSCCTDLAVPLLLDQCLVPHRAGLFKFVPILSLTWVIPGVYRSHSAESHPKVTQSQTVLTTQSTRVSSEEGRSNSRPKGPDCQTGNLKRRWEM